MILCILSGLGGPTGSYATAEIALKIISSTEPPQRDKIAILEEETYIVVDIYFSIKLM